MEIKKMMKYVDHTLLKPTAVRQEIAQLIDEAIEFGCASVCIPPSLIEYARDYSQGQIPLCTVVGFPNGYNSTEVKLFEAQKAIEEGADEIDMVINLGWVKEAFYEKVYNEIRALKAICQDKILKVIIECVLLNEMEKIELCKIVTAAEADFIKTSTGFAGGGATFSDVELLRKHCGANVEVKAAGGISSLEDAQEFVRLGATRLGTSRLVKIAREMA